MRYSRHATEQMAERDIVAEEVEDALGNPETTYLQHKAGREDRLVVLGTTTAGRRLKVVVLVRDEQFVLTVADREEGR